MENRFYLTTTLPYVNADPHMGFALEVVQADIIARYHRLKGEKVFFNTGTDEHGLKIYRKATEEGVSPQAYVDRYAARFARLKDPEVLNLSYDNFIRTSDPLHKAAAQEFWKRCAAAGDIYKKNYRIQYCVGCELEKTDSELVDGRCPVHPNLELEQIEEENYFFKFSKYQDALLDLYKSRPDFVTPSSRLGEIQAFVERGLEDFSISRIREKQPWGVEVPDDPSQTMYVWFDALVNYISAIGWPNDLERFNEWWPVVQIAGKDNLRQQSAMWQAMLFSAGIEPSRQILIHGFITSGGKKMSKSLGNVIDPVDIAARYGTDALRYFLAREVSTFEDSDFTEERFKEAYNANLANGLGNLVSRVLKMAETNGVQLDEEKEKDLDAARDEVGAHMSNFEIQKATDVVWGYIGTLDRFVQSTEPFKTIKTDPEKAKEDIAYLMRGIAGVAEMLVPFLPETAEKIKTAVQAGKATEPLFMRK